MQKTKRKFYRIFFSTDVHSSEVVFRKFIGTAKFYQVDMLVMGGDVTGKTVVPLVEEADGTFHLNFQGQEFRKIPANAIVEYETRVMNAGLYPYRVSVDEYESLRSDDGKVTALFDRLMIERLNRWAKIAEENLTPLGVNCYWTGGNDDKQNILDDVESTEHFVNLDGKVVTLETGQEMVNLGWSNPTPWATPRECSEEELENKLRSLTSQIKEPSSCIFNVHVPPFDSSLDIAAKLDTSFDPPKPYTEGGQPIMIPVGSTAVRKSIEEVQPLLMLCGHIHETKNATKIKGTTCINPGSEYQAGVLRGVIVNVQKNKVLSYQFTSG
ncbi:MAG TPA: metallophosphoesterase [Candidatus Bathyarchaeia archaeon]|nr:metallophosphoesterase [Candidatus Bathyarchaeia archaeon]